MDSQILYRVQREDLPRLQKMLVECFARDPLYETLIPDAETRKRLETAGTAEAILYGKIKSEL